MQPFHTGHWLIIEWNVTESCHYLNKLLVEDKQVEEPNFDFNVFFDVRELNMLALGINKESHGMSRSTEKHAVICKILVTPQI